MIVADASVINKLFLPNEANYQQANELVTQHTRGKEKIIVPNLIYYEVANTLVTKSLIPLSVVTKSLSDLYSLNFEIFNLTEKNLKTVAKMAKNYKISVYDATYVVLAKQKKCDLFTADKKLLSKANLPFVKNLADYSTGVDK